MLTKLILCLVLYVCMVLSRPEEFPPPEVAEFIEPIHEICTKLHGVTDDEVKTYDISDKSKKMMCYMKCLLIESKWAKPDETINYEVIEQTLHPKVADVLLPAVQNCRNIPDGNEDCEKSYNFLACLQKQDPEHFFLP